MLPVMMDIVIPDLTHSANSNWQKQQTYANEYTTVNNSTVAGRIGIPPVRHIINLKVAENLKKNIIA